MVKSFLSKAGAGLTGRIQHALDSSSNVSAFPSDDKFKAVTGHQGDILRWSDRHLNYDFVLLKLWQEVYCGSRERYILTHDHKPTGNLTYVGSILPSRNRDATNISTISSLATPVQPLKSSVQNLSLHDVLAMIGTACLAGRNVIVTGASRGIGHAIAVAFASHGARKMVLVGRDTHRLAEAQAEISQTSSTVISLGVGDVRHRPFWQSLTKDMVSSEHVCWIMARS